MDSYNFEDFLKEHEEGMLKHLEKSISIPSVSSDLKNVYKALEHVLRVGEELGFEVRSELNGQVGVIEMGEGDEILGILTHIDVVPPGDMTLWETPPFEMVEKDGKLFGRGTLDDKGAVFASLYAMKAVKESGKKLYKKVQLIIGTQEEVQWTDMDAYVEKFTLPDYGFTPDGEFPLCNIEKGIVDAGFRFKVEECERKDGRYVESISAGYAVNSVPGKCVYTVATYDEGSKVDEEEITVMGKGVHSCQPEMGDNALIKAAKEIAKGDFQENTFLKVAKLIAEYFDSMFGEKFGLASEDEYYNGEFIHRNVFTPTVIKTLAEGETTFIELSVNSRTAYGTDENEVVEVFNKWAEENDGELIRSNGFDPVYISKDRPFMKEFAKAYEEETGLENEFVLAYGGSYAKAMPNIVSWGPIFLGEEDTCHVENEYINRESLLLNSKIFANAIGRIVFSDKSFK